MLNKMYAIFYYAQRKKNIINFKQLDFIMDKKRSIIYAENRRRMCARIMLQFHVDEQCTLLCIYITLATTSIHKAIGRLQIRFTKHSHTLKSLCANNDNSSSHIDP